MKRVFLIVICCLSALLLKANDGVFYASGNQLIPITETDIRVQKEVLTINRVGDHLEVTVYYEFFNPAREKDLLVGFEAEAPYPFEDEYMKVFPQQPRIRNFQVIMNKQKLDYEISCVDRHHYDQDGDWVRPPYYVDGKFVNWTRQQCEDSIAAFEHMAYPFDFVYHFKAHFQKGLNTIQHTYEYDLSTTIETEYYFPYILTAANRWANNGIDDFTLNINMGERESFMILKGFFESVDEWDILGVGTYDTLSKSLRSDEEEGWLTFHMQKGSISFHKKNFHPDDELWIEKSHMITTLWNADKLPGGEMRSFMKGIKTQYYTLDTAISGFFNSKMHFTREQKRVLRNLPLAYHGYLFKSKKLGRFFEDASWYIPDSNYNGDVDALTPKEKLWVEYWSR